MNCCQAHVESCLSCRCRQFCSVVEPSKSSEIYSIILPRLFFYNENKLPKLPGMSVWSRWSTTIIKNESLMLRWRMLASRSASLAYITVPCSEQAAWDTNVSGYVRLGQVNTNKMPFRLSAELQNRQSENGQWREPSPPVQAQQGRIWVTLALFWSHNTFSTDRF